MQQMAIELPHDLWKKQGKQGSRGADVAVVPVPRYAKTRSSASRACSAALAFCSSAAIVNGDQDLFLLVLPPSSNIKNFDILLALFDYLSY